MHHARYLGAQRLLLALTMAIPVRASSETNAGAGHEVVLQFNEAQIRAGGIETQLVVHESSLGELVVPGVVTVPPQQMRVVAAPAAGLVETLLVVPDEDVKQGAPIATLKSWDLIEAQRSFLHALSAANLAAEKLRRDEQLFKEHIIAERRLIVTRAEAIQARSALEERKQILSLVGMSDEDVASLQRERTLASSLQVRAPIAGTILQRHGKTGERVQASTPLVTIACLDPIWVNLQIPIIRAAALESGSRISSWSPPAAPWPGCASNPTHQWQFTHSMACSSGCGRQPPESQLGVRAYSGRFRRTTRDPCFRNAAIRLRAGVFES
ncbi:MAG: Efflux transporter RND family MFP [Methylocystaceae bacterium]|nr:MAG: Efflux transporter RND family MFP [Methylocystaceae bacterium]